MIHVIDTKGKYSPVRLCADAENGGQLQAAIEAGAWFAAECLDRGSYSLVGCTVAPGFDFADFELADSERLSERFPQQAELIARLTVSP